MNPSNKTGRLMIILLFCLTIFFFWGNSAHAVMLKMDLEELTEGADKIIVGTVLSSSSKWNEDRTSIFTKVTILVEERLKYAAEYQEITIIVPGGEAEGITQVVSDMPEFRAGERVLLFLDQLAAHQGPQMNMKELLPAAPIFSMHGHFQGKLGIIEEKVGALSLNEVKDQVRSFISGKNFCTEPASTDDDPVLVGSSPYVFNGQKWFGAWPVVDYKINASGGPTDGCTLTALQNASNTWNNAGAKFSFDNAGTHTRTGSYTQNMVNEITWHNLGNTSTLAQAIWWFYSSTGEIIEADMIFNTYHTWSTAAKTPAGTYDVETVALHEFGHWLSLGHSSTYEAIMWPNYKGTQRTLHPDDIAGITTIYGAATAGLSPESYELNVDRVGQGRTDPKVGIHEYDEGTQITLTATPGSGWRFEKWVINSVAYDTSILEVTMDANKTASAHFAEIQPKQFALTIEKNGQGSTDPAAGNYEYDEGTQVNLTAIPASGWQFEKWVINDTEHKQSTVSASMETVTTAIAYFEELEVEDVLPPELDNMIFIGNLGLSIDLLFDHNELAREKINDALKDTDVSLADVLIHFTRADQLFWLIGRQVPTEGEVDSILSRFIGYWNAAGEWIDWLPDTQVYTAVVDVKDFGFGFKEITIIETDLPEASLFTIEEMMDTDAKVAIGDTLTANIVETATLILMDLEETILATAGLDVSKSQENILVELLEE